MKVAMVRRLFGLVLEASVFLTAGCDNAKKTEEGGI